MPKSLVSALFAAGLAAVQMPLGAAEAEARIVCRDGFQSSGGREISTPYCRDAHLAEIARRHGVRVSDAEVRANPARKDEVCRFLAGNMYARDYCPDDGSSDRGR